MRNFSGKSSGFSKSFPDLAEDGAPVAEELSTVVTVVVAPRLGPFVAERVGVGVGTFR